MLFFIFNVKTDLNLGPPQDTLNVRVWVYYRSCRLNAEGPASLMVKHFQCKWFLAAGDEM